MLSTEFGEGNGTPLQYSCLENPMDGGAWEVAIHGVTKGVGHNWVTSLSLSLSTELGFPGGASGKEPAWQRRRHKGHRFDP